MELSDLVNLARQHQIPLNSNVSECIIKADLQRALDPDHQVRFGPDPLGNQLALEAGMDYRVQLSNATRVRVRKWLSNQGIAETYLDDSALTSAVGAVIYERNLKPPQIYHFGSRDILYIYAMSEYNFRMTVLTLYQNDTPEELLHSGYLTLTNPLEILLYQTTDQLLALAESLPLLRLYFKTRIGILDYLYNYPGLNYLEYFERIHGEAYPERRTWFGLMSDKFVPGYALVPDDSWLLAMPPAPFERDYLYYSIFDPSNLTSYFITLSQLSQMDNDIGDNGVINLVLQNDPQIVLNSRQELAQIVDSGDKLYRKLCPELLYRLTGWKNVVSLRDMNMTIYEAHEDTRNQFRLMTNVDICSNREDFLLNPLEGFVITYGTFLNFVCYSPEELEAAFTIEDDSVIFRKPDRPGEIFSLEEIQDLGFLLGHQNPEYIPGFEERIDLLLDKIDDGLAEYTSIDLEEVSEVISKLSNRDKDLAQRIFWSWFLAGMYQRTWDGVGAYPMKLEETTGSCQADIKIRMTPLLNEIRSRYLELSPESQDLISKLHLVDYNRRLHVWISRAEFLIKFEEEVRTANFCIGYGSSLMIYSGYFYLKALGVEIPNFDLDTFEAKSTHR